MALTYKTDVITLNAVSTDFTILTASASSTLVKNISWIHDDHNTNVILSLTKSGGSKIAIGEFAATANVPLKIWTDILPLGANDILHLQSDHISGSDVGYCVISYVEDTVSVAGQSIAVHTDVNITGVTGGQTLEWNASSTSFEPVTPSSGLTNTDGLTEGSSNLYYTEARVNANANVTANSAKISYTDSAAVTANSAKISADGLVTTHSDVSNAGSGAIITSTERTKLSGIATSATANDTDANLVNRSNHTGTQAASTISDFDTEVSNNSAVTANTAKVSYTDASAVALNTAKTGITSVQVAAIASNTLHRQPFEFDSFVTGANSEFLGDITVASDRVVDVMNDALAAKNNANAKKFLAWHVSGGNCVLQGIIDVKQSISGATAGGALYLGASGSLQSAATTTATEYSRIIGYYIDTLGTGEVMCYFDPSKDWIQID
tara:strand:+ start:2124 stop:3437 length:1314 start_codon:yes stop_codon:yes gene_type:complete